MDHKTILNLQEQLKKEKQPHLKNKKAAIDYSDEEFDSIPKQEKLKMLSKNFKFKTEMLTSKVLLLDSSYLQSEVNQLKDNVDSKPNEFLSKLLSC